MMFAATPQQTVEHITRRVCVVLVIDDLGYGGAERQVVELANNMDRDRFDVHVCTLSRHVPLRAALRDADRRLHVVAKRNRLDLTVVLRLAHLLRRLDADIVHGYLYSAEVVTRLAGRLAGTGLVVGSERNANRPIERRLLVPLKLTRRCTDLVIANSNAGAEFNAKVFGLPAAHYRVVHNGVDTTRFRPADAAAARERLAIPAACPVIGAFANLKKQKNHPMLFRAFRLVLDAFPDARLLLVGERPADSRGTLDEYQAQLQRLIDDLGIRQQCVSLGHQRDVEHLYPACDVTALCSSHEGTPNVLLESMACGVPVVATNVCDNGCIVREGEVGYLVPAGDETAMADRLKRLASDAPLRGQMGRKARNWVLQEFSTRRLAEKMEAVYLELLAGKASSAYRQAGLGGYG